MPISAEPNLNNPPLFCWDINTVALLHLSHKWISKKIQFFGAGYRYRRLPKKDLNCLSENSFISYLIFD